MFLLFGCVGLLDMCLVLFWLGVFVVSLGGCCFDLIVVFGFT